MARKKHKTNVGVSITASPLTQVIAIALSVTVATVFVLAINALMY